MDYLVEEEILEILEVLGTQARVERTVVVDRLEPLEIKVSRDHWGVQDSQVILDWMEILASLEQLEVLEIPGFADYQEVLVTLGILVLLDRVGLQVTHIVVNLFT